MYFGCQICYLFIILVVLIWVFFVGYNFYYLCKVVYVKIVDWEKVILVGILGWIRRYKLLSRGYGSLFFMVMFYICMCWGMNYMIKLLFDFSVYVY